MTDKKRQKKISILLLSGEGYGEKSYSRLLQTGISNTIIYFEGKLILTTQGKAEEQG